MARIWKSLYEGRIRRHMFFRSSHRQQTLYCPGPAQAGLSRWSRWWEAIWGMIHPFHNHLRKWKHPSKELHFAIVVGNFKLLWTMFSCIVFQTSRIRNVLVGPSYSQSSQSENRTTSDPHSHPTSFFRSSRIIHTSGWLIRSWPHELSHWAHLWLAQRASERKAYGAQGGFGPLGAWIVGCTKRGIGLAPKMASSIRHNMETRRSSIWIFGYVWIPDVQTRPNGWLVGSSTCMSVLFSISRLLMVMFRPD